MIGRFLGRAIGSGLAAGAAGTTALNAATYLDMAVRGRGTSEMPEKAVEELTRRAGQEIPGSGGERDNRVQGIGALSGIATGVGVGVVAGFLGPVLRRLPSVLSAVALGGFAMAATDASMARLGLTDPKSWSAEDWLSDALPHLAYGAAATYTLRAAARTGD